jgi:hypothetical protein
MSKIVNVRIAIIIGGLLAPSYVHAQSSGGRVLPPTIQQEMSSMIDRVGNLAQRVDDLQRQIDELKRALDDQHNTGASK